MAVRLVTPPAMLDACTIVARNYLPYARVLARSLSRSHPDCRLTVLVIDGAASPSDASLFRTLSFADVLPDDAERQRLAFIYDVTELCTAVKPLLIQRLLRDGARSVLYFDPDIEIRAPLADLWGLAAEHGIVLTPHVLEPIPDDGLSVTDLFVLRAGAYNLGFIGVGQATEDFLGWWWSCLRRHCLSAVEAGMFVDQRWLDFVPGMFRHVLARDPGLNVAYWNLHERRLSRDADGVTVNGRPLRFFHYSGFDPETPHLLSRHQGANPRILLSEQPVVRDLCAAYQAALRADGLVPVRVPYGYATLPDGTPIDMIMRRAYRDALLDAERNGKPLPPLPFESDALLSLLNEPAPEAPRVTRYLYSLHQHRPDLRTAFPGPHGDAASAYLNWARADPAATQAIPDSLRPPRESASDAASEALPAGVNIAGYFRAELGVGEVGRSLLAAARDGGVAAAAVLDTRTLNRQEDPSFAPSAQTGPYRLTLVCANADELPRAVDALPRSMIERAHRAALWFWETEELPRAYAAAADLVDEIWAGSEYVAAAIRKTVAKPVMVCPLPLRTIAAVPASRAALGLPDGFVFLFVYDLLSVLGRKNPLGLIEAFCRAFRLREGPTLVLKSINGRHARADLEAVRAAAAGRLDIVVRDGYVSARERDALLTACDCYVSLHRSEGFGLTMAEAMALGKPTIATGYSGNLDFMTPSNSFLVPWRPGFVPAGCAPYPTGHRWAEPDLAAAAALMRTVYQNPAFAREHGARARGDVLERLSSGRAAVFLRERIAAASRVASAEPLSAELTEIHAAARELAEAEHAILDGITYATPSRFGWPGRVIRTGMLRLVRPFVQLETRVHHAHIRATARVLESLEARAAERPSGSQRVSSR
jgi:glycosyltransferase involved in cell wall biosynthesis